MDPPRGGQVSVFELEKTGAYTTYRCSCTGWQPFDEELFPLSYQIYQDGPNNTQQPLSSQTFQNIFSYKVYNLKEVSSSESLYLTVSNSAGAIYWYKFVV
jgi:hypothetical protein